MNLKVIAITMDPAAVAPVVDPPVVCLSFMGVSFSSHVIFVCLWRY